MADDVCSVEGCENRATKRGWCGKHYQRWRKYGDPLTLKHLPRGICRVEGCKRVAQAKELCTTHYNRWLAHGDPLAVAYIVGDHVKRFWSKVDRRGASECWPWLGYVAPTGYGQMGIRHRSVLAHRMAYELLRGPIPAEMDLDHTCHDPAVCFEGTSCPHRRCVNPAHLQPATHRANLLRSNSPAMLNAQKESCDQGHAFDDENTYRRPSGGRECRACRRVPVTAG